MKFVVLASAVVLLASAAPQYRGWDPKRGDTEPVEEVAPWDPKRGDAPPEERKTTWWYKPKEEVAPWDPKRGDTEPKRWLHGTLRGVTLHPKKGRRHGGTNLKKRWLHGTLRGVTLNLRGGSMGP